MSNPRILITTLRQLIQLPSKQLTTREIARALSLSQGAVWKYGRAVLAAGLTWEEALSLEEVELERRIWAVRRATPTRSVAAPDCAWIHTELKRHKHVTLQLLWEEYHATHGAAVQLVLRAIPALGEAPAALDAPASLRRREVVRRLCGAHGANLRRELRGGVSGGVVCRRVGRERLCVRGSDAHGKVAGLAR